MAKTSKGKKKVYVHSYTYKTKSGKTIKVGQHYRSTPDQSYLRIVVNSATFFLFIFVENSRYVKF